VSIKQYKPSKAWHKSALIVLIALSSGLVASCDSFQRFSSERYICSPNRANIAQIDIHKRSGTLSLSINRFDQNLAMEIVFADENAIVSRHNALELTIERHGEEPKASVLINDVFISLSCLSDSKFSM